MYMFLFLCAPNSLHLCIHFEVISLLDPVLGKYETNLPQVQFGTVLLYTTLIAVIIE